MQNASSQYGPGPPMVPQNTYQQPETSPNSSSTTSSLRQFRKKDPSIAATNNEKNNIGEHHQHQISESHVARVAPHNHYPPQKPPEYFRYQQPQHYQNNEYGVAQQLGDHVQTSVIQKTAMDKSKEYMEMCNIQAKNLYGEHIPQNGYGNEMMQQSQMQYMQKDVQQMHHGYKPEAHQYYQKEQLQKYGHMQPQMRKYPPQNNDFLSKLRRIHPDVARNILNEHQQEAAQQVYANIDQRPPMYQNQRYYAGTIQGNPYPPQNAYYSPYPPCAYGRPNQRPAPTFSNAPQPPRGVAGNHYAYPTPYGASTPEYAQHYQHRRAMYQPHAPQQYIGHHQQVPAQEMAESRVSPSDSLKKFIENFDADEETELVSSEEHPREQNTETVYMINASELQYFGDNGIPLVDGGVPLENCQYVIKGGVTIDNNTAMVRFIENPREDVTDKIVNLHLVESGAKPDCMLEKNPPKTDNKKVVVHQNTVVQPADQMKSAPFEEKVLVDKNCSPINMDHFDEDTQEEESKKAPKNMPIIDIFNESEDAQQEKNGEDVIKTEAADVENEESKESAPVKIKEEMPENEEKEIDKPSQIQNEEVTEDATLNEETTNGATTNKETIVENEEIDRKGSEEPKEKSPSPDMTCRRTKRIFSVDDIINNIGNKLKAIESCKDPESEEVEKEIKEEMKEGAVSCEESSKENNIVLEKKKLEDKIEEIKVENKIEENEEECTEESPNNSVYQGGNNKELNKVDNANTEIKKSIVKDNEDKAQVVKDMTEKVLQKGLEKNSNEEIPIIEEISSETVAKATEEINKDEENLVESPQIAETCSQIIENPKEKEHTEESSEKSPDSVQYRNAIKIEESSVLLEISGVLVEITVNIVNGKKVLSVLPISNSAVVDFNDNYENFTFDNMECEAESSKEEIETESHQCEQPEDTSIPAEEIHKENSEEPPREEEEEEELNTEEIEDVTEAKEEEMPSLSPIKEVEQSAEEIQELPPVLEHVEELEMKNQESTQISSITSNIEAPPPLEEVPTNEIVIADENVTEEIHLESSEDANEIISEIVTTTIIVSEEIKKKVEVSPEEKIEERTPVICTKAAKKAYENELQIPAVTTSEDVSKMKNKSPPHQINDVSSSKEKEKREPSPKKKTVKKSKRISEKQNINEERKKLFKKLMVERREKKLKNQNKEEDEFVDFKELLRARRLKKMKKMQEEMQAKKEAEEKTQMKKMQEETAKKETEEKAKMKKIQEEIQAKQEAEEKTKMKKTQEEMQAKQEAEEKMKIKKMQEEMQAKQEAEEKMKMKRTQEETAKKEAEEKTKMKKMQEEMQAKEESEEKTKNPAENTKKPEIEDTKEKKEEAKAEDKPKETNTKQKSYRQRTHSEDSTLSDTTKETIEEKSPKKVTFSDVTIINADNNQVTSVPVISSRDPRKSAFYQVMVPSVSEMLTDSEKASFRKKRKLSLEEYNSRKKSKNEEKCEEPNSEDLSLKECFEFKAETKILPTITNNNNWEDSQSPKHVQDCSTSDLKDFGGLDNKISFLKPKDDSLEAYKEQVDSKLSTLNITIPRVSKNVVPKFSSNDLLHRFLNNEKLSSEEMDNIRKIITYKRLMQSIRSPELSNSPRSSNYEVSKNACEDTKLHLKKISSKRPRFRNLNVDSSSESSEDDSDNRIDYKVIQSDSLQSGVPKLIIKRRIEAPQPVVRLERLDVDVLKKRKCQ